MNTITTGAAERKADYSSDGITTMLSALLRRGLFPVFVMTALLLTGMEARAQQTYYSQGNYPVNLTTSWNTQMGGGGSQPADFTGNHNWIIQTGNAMTMTGDWTVGGPATVTLNGGLTVPSAYNVIIDGTITVSTGATLQMTGESTVTGVNGTFVLSDDGTLGITSADGITADPATMTGNIRTSAGRIFSSGATYLYNGTVHQWAGTGLPASITGNITVNKPAQALEYDDIVRLISYCTIESGAFINVISGIFNGGTSDGAGYFLTMGANSAIYRSGGRLEGGNYGPGPYDVYYTGNFIDQPFEEAIGPGLRNLNINLTAGRRISLTSPIEPDGDLILTSGIMDLSSNSCNRSTFGGTLNIADGARMEIGGTGTLPANYQTVTIAAGSTVLYGGDAQTITSARYGNLILDGGGIKTIASGDTVTVVTSLVTNNLLTIQSSGVSSSGSLIVNGTSTGNVTYNRQMNPVLYHYFSSPVATATFPTAGTVWAYNEATGAWDITTACESGRGYTLQTGISELSFTGPLAPSGIVIDASSPYSDFITGDETNYGSRTFAAGRDLNYGGGGWNLLGNPYTSALRVSDFIAANFSTTPASSNFDPNYVALYLFNGSTYQYVSISTGWENGTYLDEEYIQAGQGFFVLAMNDNSTFTFSQSMQGHDAGVTLLKSAKTGERWPGLQLKVKNAGDQDYTTVVFNDDMTAGLDPGYDVGLMSAGKGIGLYTSLVEDNGINFARQALPVNGYNKNIVPVGVDFSKGGEVTFSAVVEKLRNFKFILEDRLTGIFTDLNSNSYTVSLPANISGTGRFFVHVSAGRNLRQRAENTNLPDLGIWTSNGNQVNVQGTVSEKATCQVFDSRGHKILDIRLADSFYNTFSMPSVIKGVYLVRVTDGLQVVTKKVLFL